MKTIIIDSERQKRFCQTMLEEMPIDGSKIIVFKNTDMSPTAKQRRLRWLWLTETAKSGLGSNNTKEGADLTAKWQFARPILLRDNEIFGTIYNLFMKVVENSEHRSEQIKEFTRDYISIEKLMSRKQEAEHLRDFQSFWTEKGVNLTDPSLQGLDQYLGYKPTKSEEG